MPSRASPPRTSGCSSAGTSTSRACPGPSRASRTSRPSLRPVSSSALQGSIVRAVANGLEIVEPMVSTAAERWDSERSFHHSRYSAARIAAERECSVSVCLPARECAETVGEIVSRLGRLRDAGAIDEVVVVDAASPDGTATVAEQAGARVVQEAELMPAFGPVLGKGDAMWRALSVLSGEAVVYLDADSAGFSEHFATGLLGPLVCEPDVQFVKAFYRRPFQHNGVSMPEGGGQIGRASCRERG